jgi:hypothetical protein
MSTERLTANSNMNMATWLNLQAWHRVQDPGQYPHQAGGLHPTVVVWARDGSTINHVVAGPLAIGKVGVDWGRVLKQNCVMVQQHDVLDRHDDLK